MYDACTHTWKCYSIVNWDFCHSALVLYEDFLDTLDRAAGAEGRISLSASLRNSSSGGFVNGSGYDGLRTSHTNDGWDDDLRRFRQSNSYHPGDYPIELEEGSDSAFGGLSLSPPKPSDSLSFPRGATRHGSPSRYHQSYSTESPRSSFQRTIPVPKSSPSKVGSKMWGSDTPLAKKGKVVNVGEGNWCCAVCLYTENSLQASTCAVCDSPNYTIRKVRTFRFWNINTFDLANSLVSFNVTLTCTHSTAGLPGEGTVPQLHLPQRTVRRRV